MRQFLLLSSPLVVLATLSCSAGESSGTPRQNPIVNPGPGNPDVQPVSPVGVDPGPGGLMGGDEPFLMTPATPTGGGEAPPGCGNGELTEDEVCDDGNTASGDGCSANCQQLEPGFSCSVDGQPCLRVAVCGDGVKAESEQCDDGNRDPGDGCSDRCKFEQGFTCEGEPGVCRPTVCGDSIMEGAESCDDGNVVPFDGCSDVCVAEPSCPGGQDCTSQCGDGLLINEDCDDGNQISGDGCSSTCTIEPGFTCVQNFPPPEQVNAINVFRVPVVYRDHSDSHPDFGKNPNECTRVVEDTGEVVPANVLTTGMVARTLDAEGRPQLAAGTTAMQECTMGSYTGITQFDDWFRDGPHVMVAPSSLVLFDNGAGGYVNRFTEDGEQFEGYVEDSEEWDDQGDLTCSWCLDGDCEDPCSAEPMDYDGSPLFFPVDHITGPTADMGEAKVPAEYGFLAWPWEGDVFGGSPKHNFYFTTEVKTWFKYDATTNATLEFTGDDDVWVYVNGTLAVDLGGIHGPEDGAVTISSTTAATFGLVAGNVYELSVFQAERRMEGSSFRLTLSGFEQAPSDCSPECGDGIVSFGEECDDGVNDGGYGECAPGCVLGAYCGDGVVSDGENCDPGIDPTCVGCRRRMVL